MRILPDNPNLGFLRREAKDLLVALRESDPSTSLSDAQRAVAQEYGFRDWPELKREVERRRATPPAADPDLTEAIAAAFGLGAPVGSMTPISYAYMGRRWRLETAQGVYLVGPVFDWIGNHQAERAAELRGRARNAGVVAPKPVRSPDGQLVQRVAEQSWRIDEWLDLGPEVLPPVRRSVAKDVGRTLAVLHSVGMPSDEVVTPGQPGHLTCRRPESDWDQLIERATAANVPWLEGLVRLRRDSLAGLEAIPFRQTAGPLIVCIADLNMSTVRLGPRDELVLVHWDFAGPSRPEWELPYVLLQWVVYPASNPGTAAAIAVGYREHAGTFPTLDPSAFWLAITGHLNWTYNQFSAALDASDDEQRSFAEAELTERIDRPLTADDITQLLAEVNTENRGRGSAP